MGHAIPAALVIDQLAAAILGRTAMAERGPAEAGLASVADLLEGWRQDPRAPATEVVTCAPATVGALSCAPCQQGSAIASLRANHQHAPREASTERKRGRAMTESTGQSRIGVTGLAVMGANLARNIARRGVPVAVHNRTTARTKEFMDAYSSEGTFTAASPPRTSWPRWRSRGGSS